MSDLDEITQKISDLEKAIEKDIPNIVQRQGLRVQGAAKMNCPVRRFGSGGGALRQSIYEKTEQQEDSVTSTVYTDLLYATFVEFGTGPAGEQHHSGISPAVNPVYSPNGWMMPASAMEPEDAESYGFGIAKKDGEIIGYYTNGQRAQPFLYPALNDLREDISESIQKELGDLMKKFE